MFCFQASAVTLTGLEGLQEIEDAIQNELDVTGAGGTVYVDGIITAGSYGTPISLEYTNDNQTIVWSINAPDHIVEVMEGNYTGSNFQMNGSAELNHLTLVGLTGDVRIDGNVELQTLEIDGGTPNITIAGNAKLLSEFDMDGLEAYITLEDNAQATILNPNEFYNDNRGQNNEIVPDVINDETEELPETGEEIEAKIDIDDNSGDVIIVVITDKEPFEEDGKQYYGTVDIKDYFTDAPKEIPDEVFIDGMRYAVGDVVYIVSKKDLELVGYTNTGLAYVFPAVENVEMEVKYSAEGLPEGLELTEDGVLYTTKLPLPAGETTLSITADNGVDTHTIEIMINIKHGYEDDDELKDNLSLNDKEDQPDVLSDYDEDGNLLNLWINDELKLHYDPELDDFVELFLDGELLEEGMDYIVEEGSTVIILTEQTMIPLASGDHVITTMFNQNSDVGLDTVINDVGSSSFVFRFGDDKANGKRINIGGDGVEGSVTFDDSASKEEPITTITANSEEIQQRAANLSNATGREIIAAFETKNHGGFGNKTATFAVSVKSLDLTLKNGTAVYVAVYDSTTGKTYQNKGEVKGGMIVFRTKHSGVFMVAKDKF
jgi:hypothetical protein